ncbi:MAG TPA: CmcI family methyltransferase, partial [Polyangia bacterium]
GAYQSRAELAWLWQEHLLRLRPCRIIEIGVAAGGTTRLFLDVAGEQGLVVGIDIDDGQLASDVRTHPRFRLLLGPSTDARVLQQVRALMPACDLLLIDGDHSETGVLADTAAYLPLVREGGLVLWHDVQLESPMGIKRAWYRVLKPQLPDAHEHFADPFNTGFGIWKKRGDVIVRTDAAPAVMTNDRRGDPIGEAVRIADDVTALRAEVTDAILRGLEAAASTGDDDERIVEEVAPRVAASFVRLQQWRAGIAFVTAVTARAPRFAPHALRALTKGLRRANALGAAREDLAEVATKSFLEILRRAEPGRDAGHRDAAVAFGRALRECRRADLALLVCRTGLAQARDHLGMMGELATTLLELRTGAKDSDELLLAEARALLRGLLSTPGEGDVKVDWQLVHLFVGSHAGDEREVAAARAALVQHSDEARTPLRADDPDLATSLAARIERFGFSVVTGALAPRDVAALSASHTDATGSRETALARALAHEGIAAGLRARLGAWYLDAPKDVAERRSVRSPELIQDARVHPRERRCLGAIAWLGPGSSTEESFDGLIAHRCDGLF